MTSTVLNIIIGALLLISIVFDVVRAFWPAKVVKQEVLDIVWENKQDYETIIQEIQKL